jgi:two-component system osmolarity sensor histidine kinase EnvZ
MPLDGIKKLTWESYFSDAKKIVKLRPNNFSRAIKNLIENANNYGTKITISFKEKNNKILINIEDNGPGIPKEKIKEALKPFVRLDNSRNLNRPQGVGLGLSIASDTIKSHGGTLNLKKSYSLGGLKASISIPL